MNQCLEEVDPRSILVVNGRGIPLRVPTAIQRLSVELDLYVLDVCDCLVQLVGGCVELNEEKTAFCGERLTWQEGRRGGRVEDRWR